MLPLRRSFERCRFSDVGLVIRYPNIERPNRVCSLGPRRDRDPAMPYSVVRPSSVLEDQVPQDEVTGTAGGDRKRACNLRVARECNFFCVVAGVGWRRSSAARFTPSEDG